MQICVKAVGWLRERACMNTCRSLVVAKFQDEGWLSGKHVEEDGHLVGALLRCVPRAWCRPSTSGVLVIPSWHRSCVFRSDSK